MNLHFTFSVREISEVRDADQTIKIPMYLAISWEVGLMKLKLKYFFDLSTMSMFRRLDC